MKYTPRHLTKPNRWRAILGEALYYIALALFVLGVFLLRGSGDGPPARILGFSAMRVLTSSMGEDLPQGSLIITHSVDPKSLEVGDDITYLVSQNATVTHRIVGIEEDGELSFITQGTKNEAPDSLPVPSENIVGKVVFHSLPLGHFFTFFRAHWPWISVLLLLFIALGKALQVLFRESREEKAEKEPEERRDEE